MAGLGGAVEGLGNLQDVYVQGASLAVGFNGMAVSLLAANSPIGILFAAFLFGVLQVGAPGMNAAQVPSEACQHCNSVYYLLCQCSFTLSNALSNQKQVKGGKVKMSVTTLLHPLGVFYADLPLSTSHLTSIGGVFPERGGW